MLLKRNPLWTKPLLISSDSHLNRLFGNFHVEESSASRDLLEGNDEVCVPGPIPCDLRSVHRGVKRLSKQMHDRYKTEKRMVRILRQEELHRNGQAFDVTALDSAVRANTFESSKMMRTMPPKRRSRTNPQLTLTQEDVDQLVQDGITATIRDKRERVRREATRAEGPMRDPVTAPISRECSFSSFMKCGPTQFHGTEGAVGLVRWFEKMENTFKIRHKAKDCRGKKAGPGAAVQPNIVCYSCGERGHKSFECPKKADQRGRNVPGQAYVIRDAEHNQGPNVVTGTFLLNNHYATVLFDSGADKSLMDIKFSHLIDIKPVKLNSSYEVKLANGKVVSTNSVMRGCTLNQLNYLFDIDLMPIELGTFDVIVGMDWLVERDALIVYRRKEVHVPYKNKTLVVKSDSEPVKKQLQNVPVIYNFLEVFPDDLPGLPPPRQVEFKIKLIPGAAPVAHAPYRLAPSELKELSDQLKELSEKGFYA
nr:reverse transcriptase domain-containing protein [Tanacetum cinerariifolium]